MVYKNLGNINQALPEGANTIGNVRVHDRSTFYFDSSPHGVALAASPKILCGGDFYASTLDTTYWTKSEANSATASFSNGEAVLTSGTDSAGRATLYSAQRAIHHNGTSNTFRAFVRFSNTGTADNRRRFGVGFGASMPSLDDGLFFYLDGTTFGVAKLTGGSFSSSNSGSFNGSVASYSIDTNVHLFEIVYTTHKAHFYIDGILLHTLTATTSHLCNTSHHHAFFENENDGSTTSVGLTVSGGAIHRVGHSHAQPTYKYNTGTTTGVVAKYGPGLLRSVTLQNVAATAAVTIYDNTAASGTVIYATGPIADAAITVPRQVVFGGGIQFNLGLTLVVATASAGVLLEFE